MIKSKSLCSTNKQKMLNYIRTIMTHVFLKDKSKKIIILCKIFVYLGPLRHISSIYLQRTKQSLRLQRPAIFFLLLERYFIRICMCLLDQFTLVWGSVCPFNLKFQVLIQVIFGSLFLFSPVLLNNFFVF